MADSSLKFPNQPRHACSDGFEFTSPVRAFKPNAFGLHDMLGNVWQWMQDSWHPSYLGALSDSRPWEGTPLRFPLRGGSYLTGPEDARIAARAFGVRDAQANDAGIRVALSLP